MTLEESKIYLGEKIKIVLKKGLEKEYVNEEFGIKVEKFCNGKLTKIRESDENIGQYELVINGTYRVELNDIESIEILD